MAPSVRNNRGRHFFSICATWLTTRVLHLQEKLMHAQVIVKLGVEGDGEL